MVNENFNSDLEGESDKIAVVGIAGRYPKSSDLTGFWDNLVHGRNCLEGITDDELIELGIPESIYKRPDFIRSGTRLSDMDCFDARFFGFTPKEAQMMDPQCRIFLETAYHSLENAGYDPLSMAGRVGVFAGSNPNDYAALLGVADPSDPLTAFDQLIGSDKDFLATRVSHRLNLKGPAITLQTACSTSLVAVHVAVQSLLAYESDVAIAGGVTVNLRQGVGYIYQDGMILSPDGKCKAFDDNASGTTLGQGCGVVVLKRLVDAIEDQDHIYAVVLGSAINNDGYEKQTFLAPSENGQVDCIKTAIEIAGVPAESIGYIETHGTGTKLGDPIEIAALTRAYDSASGEKQYCAVGSVKTNYGHTDAAAGITGFIKTVLSLYHKLLVPSIHFERANTAIDFENSPFYVNTETKQWCSDIYPLRAGVSAFGIGGTNAHVVLEEAPFRTETKTLDFPLILPVSAKSELALNEQVEQLNHFISRDSSAKLEDMAYTLITGRPQLPHRAAIMVSSVSGEGYTSVFKGAAVHEKTSFVWLYPGQGSQYPGMCADLYQSEPAFKDAIDECTAIFNPLLDTDLCELLFDSENTEADALLAQTSITQPALFSVEYALSKMLASWGLAPTAVVGHSIGEFAAAVQCGVMDFKSAAVAVFHRGRLMQSMTKGDMYSVLLPADLLADKLPFGLEIAVINEPSSCVVSGPSELLSAFAKALTLEGVDGTLVNTSHAFHSAMMDEAAGEFEDIMSGFALHPPSIPMTSNVTGGWISDRQAMSPSYWASQIRSTVKFSDCVSTVSELRDVAFLEVGPGRTLASLVRRAKKPDSVENIVVNLTRHRSEAADDKTHAREAIGKLWCGGFRLPWDTFQQHGVGAKTPLPGYPFERVRHWGPSRRHQLALPILGEQPSDYIEPLQREPTNSWLYAPSWVRVPVKQSGYTSTNIASNAVRIVFLPDCSIEEQNSIDGYFSDLKNIFVFKGSEFRKIDADSYHVNPSDDASFELFFASLLNDGLCVSHVLHAWLANSDEGKSENRGSAFSESELELELDVGVFSAHAIARSVRKLIQESAQIDFIVQGAHSVTGSEAVRPSTSALLGPAKVIPLEYSGVTCRHIDLEMSLFEHCQSDLLRQILKIPRQNAILAIRGTYLWRYTVSPVDCTRDTGCLLRSNGRYLLVGGLGGVGLSIAEHLVDHYDASLVITGRTGRIERTAEDSEANNRSVLLDRIASKCGNFSVLAADAADLTSMTYAVEKAYKALGGIDGVIVAAGVADHAGSIHRRTRVQSKEAIKSKVHGSYILCDLFKDKQLDFLLFSSSIASVLHHNRFGQVGYVTANSFVEAVAQKARQCGIQAVTVAWDDWMNIGMSVRAAAEFAEKYGNEVDLVDSLHSFSPADGVTQFEYSLSVDEPTLYVSTTNLVRRMDDDVDVGSPFLEQAISTDPEEQLDISGDKVGLVQSMWKDILGYDFIADTDDFFELGGDSLQAARLTDRLSRGLKVDIGLDFVFENSVFGEMCKSIEELSPIDLDESIDYTVVGNIPLAPAQKRFLERRNKNINHFNISVMLQSDDLINPSALEQALVMLVGRCDSLHLRLANESIDTDQFFISANLNVPTLETLQIDQFGSQATNIILNEIQQSLDLVEGPVYRVLLLETKTGEQAVMFVVHHMVFDRVSLLLFLDSLNHLYSSLCQGENPELAVRTTGYAQWLNELSTHVNKNNKYLEKWSNFSSNQVKKLPTQSEYKAECNTNNSADSLKLVLSPELSEKLGSKSRGVSG